MKYGFPYKGSKNKLAERIVDFFPKATNFYDLFAGGFAVTHAALVNGKFENYYASDINPLCIELWNNAVHGKYKNETRWISREMFQELKDIDPYVSFCWSFGNNARDYLYSKELEPYKKAWHEAIFFNDFEPTKKLTNIDLSPISEIKDRHEKYLKSKQLFNDGKQLQNEYNLKQLQSLESLESLQRLERLESGVSTYSSKNIQSDSLIYCDIPYINTNCYGKKNIQSFNFTEFYDWCNSQKELTFISSYEMPERDFIPVIEFEHRSTLCSIKNNKVIEKIFIPKHQKKLFEERKEKKVRQLEFDFEVA